MPKPFDPFDLALLTGGSSGTPADRTSADATFAHATFGGEPESRLPVRLAAVPSRRETRSAASSNAPVPVIDLQAARRRLRPPVVDGRQALVLTLVEQLSGLVRGTTNPERAGAVRRAASHALDVLDRLETGEANPEEAQRAFREVESLLARPR